MVSFHSFGDVLTALSLCNVKELGGFLESLPEPTLRAIEGLMYDGRGDGDALAMVEELREFPVDDVVRSISEKVPRTEYINAGLRNLKMGLEQYRAEMTRRFPITRQP